MLTIAITTENIRINEAFSLSTIKQNILQPDVLFVNSQKNIQKSIENALSIVKGIEWEHDRHT